MFITYVDKDNLDQLVAEGIFIKEKNKEMGIWINDGNKMKCEKRICSVYSTKPFDIRRLDYGY